MLKKYALLMGGNFATRCFPILASAYLGSKGKIGEFGAFTLFYSFIQLICFIGSIGISNAWTLLLRKASLNSAQIRIFALISVLGPVLLGLGVHRLSLPGGLFHDGNGVSTAIAVAAVSFSTALAIWASVDLINDGYIYRHLIVNGAPSVVWPVTLILGGSYTQFLLYSKYSAIVLALIVVACRWKLRKNRVAEGDQIKLNADAFKIVGCGFLGSTANQIANYSLSYMLAHVEGALSAGMGLYATALQARQAILFIPAAVSNMLLKDLVENSDKTHILIKIERAHDRLALALLVAIVVVIGGGYYFLRNAGLSVSFSEFSLVLLPLSAVIILKNNYYSRIFQAKGHYIFSMLADFVFAAALICSAYTLIPKGGLLGMGLAVTVSAAAQRLYQKHIARKI